jgi:tetratricopeptide (TPR) repeat protein
MSKYDVDLDYAFPLVDISKEELNEIIAEADKIISEEKENPKELAVAYLKKAQCLYKIEQSDILTFENLPSPMDDFEFGFSFHIDDKQIYPEIKRLLEKALELSPEMPEALMRLGTVYGDDKTEKSHIDTAENLLTKAIQLKPDYAAALNNRSGLYNSDSENNIIKTINDLTEAIRIRPSDATYYYNRAGHYSELAKKIHLMAIDDLSNAVNCGSDAFKKINRIFHKRGQYYMELKEYGKAIDDFSESLKIDTDHFDTLLMRAKAHHFNWEKDKAKADIEEYLNRKRKLAYDEGKEEIFKQIGVKLEDI